MAEHAPDSQWQSKNGWVGKCRCGERLVGSDIADFNAAWCAHLDLVNNESQVEK